MITTIIGSISVALKQFNQPGAEGMSAMGGLMDMFGEGIPSYYFQIVASRDQGWAVLAHPLPIPGCPDKE